MFVYFSWETDCWIGICFRTQNFDGFVLDYSYIKFNAFGGVIIRFIRELGQRLHEQDKHLLLVIPVSKIAI